MVLMLMLMLMLIVLMLIALMLMLIVLMLISVLKSSLGLFKKPATEPDRNQFGLNCSCQS